jgi:hypothetical protein
MITRTWRARTSWRLWNPPLSQFRSVSFRSLGQHEVSRLTPISLRELQLGFAMEAMRHPTFKTMDC